MAKVAWLQHPAVLTRYRHLSESFPPFYRLAEIGLEKKSNSPYFTHVAPMRGMCGCSSVG
jgi:hypothetical protein